MLTRLRDLDRRLVARGEGPGGNRLWTSLLFVSGLFPPVFELRPLSDGDTRVMASCFVYGVAVGLVTGRYRKQEALEVAAVAGALMLLYGVVNGLVFGEVPERTATGLAFCAGVTVGVVESLAVAWRRAARAARASADIPLEDAR